MVIEEQQQLAASSALSDFDVVLLPTFEEVDEYRRRHAGRSLFAVSVTTFGDWVSGLWELYGDGRTLIGAAEREVAMKAVLDGAESFDGLRSPGFVKLAAKMAQMGAGLPDLEEALAAARAGARGFASLSENEMKLLRLVAVYFDSISDHGFVEQGAALSHLARAAVFQRPLNVLLQGFEPLSWQQRAFFEKCENLRVTVRVASGSEGVKPQHVRCSVDFACASGRYAEPALIADIVRDRFDQGPIAIACVDPTSLYDEIAPALAKEGICCEMKARKPFAQTVFGKAYMAMSHCLYDEPWDFARLADVLLSPFSGAGMVAAHELSARLAQDRLAEKEEYLSFTRASFEALSQLEELASDPEADILLGAFGDMVAAHVDWSESFRCEQQAAIDLLRRVSDAARRFGLDAAACVGILDSSSAAISRKSLAATPATVFIGTQAFIAQFAEKSMSTLILANMNSADYPVADKDDAASVLFEKLGYAPVDSALAAARRRFRALQQVPTTHLVIERATHDVNAEETYPCVVLEEFIDACKESSVAIRASAERGEEELFANAIAAPSGVFQREGAIVPDSARLALSPSKRDLMLLARCSNGAQYIAPSPSQIETYLECPRKWFVANRLNAQSKGEEFGVLEKGLFAHSVLERFYRAFQEAGFVKVLPENLDAAHELMGAVLDELVEEQLGKEPGSGRLVAVGQIEERSLEAFKKQIDSFLDYEATLLPTFAPRYMELKIGLPGESDICVEYAGVQLVGKVDRIDVDARGNAVIIDYKGSISFGYDIAGKDALYAGKVQTRIYAQAVKRALGLNVVGALYVGYDKKHGVSGAYDPCVLDTIHLPHINPEKCACAPKSAGEFSPESFAAPPGVLGQLPQTPLPSFAELSFADMLDATEVVVARAVEGMRVGEIAAAPTTQDACRYCPDLNCAKRGA